MKTKAKAILKFQSPCGVWVVSKREPQMVLWWWSFSPLAGCGLFLGGLVQSEKNLSVSVPLRGVGCFQGNRTPRWNCLVSVPLRGVGCFIRKNLENKGEKSISPLAGCGLFQNLMKVKIITIITVCFSPLVGCGLFPAWRNEKIHHKQFQSPCGVWVVSAMILREKNASDVSVPLRGVGCF